MASNFSGMEMFCSQFTDGLEAQEIKETGNVVPRSVQRRRQLTQMRCLLQNARTIRPGFLPLLFIGRAHHSAFPT
jgi:hypothetical protein